MSFQAKRIAEGTDELIELFDTTTKTLVQVYAFGALLNKFIVINNHEELNVIDGFGSVSEARKELTPAFKSAKLSPFVCRVNEGNYKFAGNTYRLSKYAMGKNAIHGLVYDALFIISDISSNETKASVTLQYNYNNPSHGYPFTFSCQVVYELSAGNTLSVTSTITNNHVDEIPVADGWHPYFTLHDSINECSFKLNSKEMLEFNDELIPTGKLIQYTEFTELRNFGTTWFDNCFTVDFSKGQPACILQNPKRKIEVQIHPAESYPYMQFYTPEHRQSIAIENLSAAPDAFNNKMGLKILAPNQSASFNTKFVIKQF